jgi:predicted O-methyltransferase YrrM
MTLKKLKSHLPNGVRRNLRLAKRAIVTRLTRPNLYSLNTQHRLGVVFTAPSDMKIEERLYLYSFIRGFRPERALEIGVLRGGSACIITNAMEDNGKGILVGVDPSPILEIRTSTLHGRYQLVTKPSPEGLPEARRLAGGKFDFVFIDGLHIYSQVARDIEGVLPHIMDGAYIMFHDAFHYGVGAAIGESIVKNPLLRDCGYVCRTPLIDYDPLTPYHGVRLLRYTSNERDDPEEAVRPFYEAAGRPAPIAAPDMLDHDPWYCPRFVPCERCKSARQSVSV